MPDFERIGKVSDIKPGEGQSYNVGEKLVGVFNVDGEFFAINDLCPHAGASLSAGHLDGCVVACPWHAWRFDVSNGAWVDNKRLKVERFEVRIDGEDLWLATTPMPEDDDAPKDAKSKGSEGE